MALSSAALSVAVLLSSQEAAYAVTPEQLLFLEANFTQLSCLRCLMSLLIYNAELPCPECNQTTGRIAGSPGCCGDYGPGFKNAHKSEPITFAFAGVAGSRQSICGQDLQWSELVQGEEQAMMAFCQSFMPTLCLECVTLNTFPTSSSTPTYPSSVAGEVHKG
jgi:hypothetical protein